MLAPPLSPGALLHIIDHSTLIDQEDLRARVALEAGLEPIRCLGRYQRIDDVHRRGEEHGVILLAGFIGQGGGQVGFP